ncbi:hypothetical protein [Spongiimicrobium sp. 3-5]|uniref:hypothetical protein n=1 Tax=Spongiimicrobium sp. 3-5 TaxID=3332596 RepID=UPI00397ED3AA
MKLIAEISIMLFTLTICGQNIKIKKGLLSIDKKEVCKVQKITKTQYNITDFEGNKILNVQLAFEDVETLQGNKQFSYLEFMKPDDNEIYYCDYDITGLKLSFSMEKTLVRHLIKKNEFLTKNGINHEEIKKFFSKSRPRSTTAEEKREEYIEAYKAVENFNLKIKGNEIVKGGEKDTIVGSYKTLTIENPSRTVIEVYDATGFLTATHDLGYIILFDGNKIEFNAFAKDPASSAKKVIERIIIAGYTLGDMQTKKYDIAMEKKQEEVKLEKRNSPNIYDTLATVFDIENKEIKGDITLEFHELESLKSNVTSLKNYGGVATLKTIKENGRDKYTDYKARDGVRICIDGTEKCYKGIKTKGLMAPKFNLEITRFENLNLYKSITFSYYIIKKENAKNGLVISTSTLLKKDNSKKMFEELFEYLGDCPKLKDEINVLEIDLNNENHLLKIVNSYNSCK